MKIFGVPWEDVREAGRLDRLYDAAIEEKHREEVRRVGGDQRDLVTRAGWWCLLHVFDIVRWGSILILLQGAAIHFLPHPFREANGWAFHPWTVAFAFTGSLPMWRAASSWDLDEFLCLRTPSREALLLARWLRMLPHLLLAGGSWAVYLAARWSDTYGENPAALAMIVAAILPAPLMVAQASLFGPVPKEGWVGTIGVEESASRWAVAGGLLILVILLRDIGKPAVDPGEVARLITRVFPLSIATIGVLAALAMLAVLLRTARRERFRWWVPPASLLRLLVAGSWALLLLLALLGPWGVAPAASGLRGFEPEVFLAVTALAFPLRTWWRLRVAAEIWPEAVLGKGKGRPRTQASATKAKPRGPVRYGGPIPSLMGAHVRYAMRSVSKGMFLAGLLGVLLLGKGLTSAPGDGYGYLVFAGLCAPRWFEIDHRQRAWMFGMDLRDQDAHNLRALAVGAALPVLALSGAILGLTENPEPGRLAFLASVLLLRAGHRGLSTMAGLETLSLFLHGMGVLGFTAVFLPGIARAWPPAPMVLAGLLAAEGVVGLVRMRRVFTEGRLLDEMRAG